MPPRYVLAVDQGTTATKALLVDQEDRVLPPAQRVLTQLYPQPGWVEMDPGAIWESIETTVAETLRAAGLSGEELEAVGLSNQGETILAWDRETGEPLSRAITWQCHRTALRCEELKQRVDEEMIRQKTGLILDPYLSATKIQWLLENVGPVQEALRRKTLHVGNLDSWMMWRLSGGKVFATDYSTASRTLLFNVHTLNWDEDLLQLFGVPREILPEPRPCSFFFGTTDPEVFLGLEVPMVGSAVDQPAALFGQTCFEKGELKVTYGTGAFLLMNIGTDFSASRHNLLTSVAASTEGERVQYYLDGGIYSVGAAVEWLLQNLKLLDDPAESEQSAASLPDNQGVYFVPALVGLAAPHWDRSVQAGFFGLTRGTTRAHLVRAVLESMAYRVLEVVQTMEEDAGTKLEEIRVDGGVSRNNFLMQFQADLLGLPLLRSANAEMTALGVAHLAGLGTGFWKDKALFKERFQVERTFTPSRPPDQLRAGFERWKKAVELARSFARP